MLLQREGFISLAQRTARYWRMTLCSFQHTSSGSAGDSAYDSCCSAGCNLNVIVNLVFADDGGWLVVVDVALKASISGWLRFMRPILLERVSFFRRLALFLDDLKRIVLLGDWNAILDPKVDRVWSGT